MPVLLGLLSEIVDPVITEQMLPGKTYQDAEGFFFLIDLGQESVVMFGSFCKMYEPGNYFVGIEHGMPLDASFSLAFKGF